MSRRINKIVGVRFPGGLIGALTINPKATIQRRLEENNSEGWNLVQLELAGDANLLIWLLKLLLLAVTLGLFTFGTGYYLIFEKEQ